jgi:hypothetical protein
VLNLDDPRLRLSDLLTRYEALSAAKKPAPAGTQSPPAATVDAFDHLVRDVIRPAMEEIGAELERRGQDYEIVVTPGQEIIMYFYPPLLRRSAYGASCCPYVSFSSDPSTAEIHIVQSTLMPNGHGRAERAVTLSAGEVTRRCVEMQILDVLEKVLDTAEGETGPSIRTQR